jgi:hypothetical protein
MSRRNLCAGAVLVTLVLAVPRSSPAQESNASEIPADGRVIGTVVEVDGGKPIPGALVMLSDGRVTETDAAGRFLFLHVRPGAHEIAAVAQGCAHAAGGFNLVSGRDALLRLEVVPPVQADRGSGSATREVTGEQLADLESHSALDAVMRYHANLFSVEGGRLALRARAASLDAIVEPLMVLDGVRLDGRVAWALDDLRARDVERIAIHMGNAAGWAFQPGGAVAVIEVTTRRGMRPPVNAQSSPDRCLSSMGR